MDHSRYKLRVTEQTTILDMKNREIGMLSNVSLENKTSNFFNNATPEGANN